MCGPYRDVIISIISEIVKSREVKSLEFSQSEEQEAGVR
jgi:hypothetical protein